MSLVRLASSRLFFALLTVCLALLITSAIGRTALFIVSGAARPILPTAPAAPTAHPPAIGATPQNLTREAAMTVACRRVSSSALPAVAVAVAAPVPVYVTAVTAVGCVAAVVRRPPAWSPVPPRSLPSRWSTRPTCSRHRVAPAAGRRARSPHASRPRRRRVLGLAAGAATPVS